MFTELVLALTAIASTVLRVHADPLILEPGPNETYYVGKDCHVAWQADTTGVWTSMNIMLQTGNNDQMVYLTTVGVVDATNPNVTTFDYDCPQVTPYSPIYFYQFTDPASSNIYWSTRFTITDSLSDVVAPSNADQPNGQAIPWGVGSLVDASTSSSASADVSSSASVASSPASSASPSTATSSSKSSALPSSSSSSSSSPSSASSSSSMVTSKLYSSTASGSIAAPTTSTNAAFRASSAQNWVLPTLAAIAFSSFGFVMLL